MSITWFLRITTNEDFSHVSRFIKQQDPSYYILCYENTSKGIHQQCAPHYHCLFSSNVLDRTIRSRIRQTYGTGMYSMKTVPDNEEDIVKVVAYCIKDGKYEVFNIPDHIIESSKGYDDKVKQDLKIKRKQPTNVYNDLASKFDLFIASHISPRDPQSSDVTDFVITYYKENQLRFRSYTVRDIITSLCLSKVPDFDKKLKIELCPL